MSVEGVHAAAGMAASQPIPVAPSADATKQLDAGELQPQCQRRGEPWLSCRECGGKRSGHDALMFGAARWKDVVSGEHSYRFGVALRALVVVSDIKVSGALTLRSRCREGRTRGRPGIGSTDGAWLRGQ